MTHDEVVRRSLADRYASGELAPAEAREFEAHLFTCDRCFEDVQAAERMRAAVRDAAGRGLLDDHERDAAASWLGPAFLVSAAVAIVLAVATGWLALGTVRSLRRDLAAERTARATASVEAERRRADLEAERAGRVALEGQFAAVEPNVPVAIVQTERAGAAATTVTVPPGARHIVVWMESVPARFGRFRLEIAASDGRVAQTIEDLVPNAQGALAAVIPAPSSGAYRARLFETSTAARALVSEYRLDVVRSAH